jgi:putative transposase
MDKQRDAFGVEPICEALQIAQSAYRRHAARARDPSLLSPRAQQDAELVPKIQQAWNANFQVYGAHKV